MKEGKEQYEIREEEPVKSGLGTYRIESQLLAAQQFHFEETSTEEFDKEHETLIIYYPDFLFFLFF